MRFMVCKMINPTHLRYIKLGEGGAWLQACLENSELRFGDLVSHEIAMGGDLNQVKAAYAEAGRKNPGDDARQLIDFYTLGEDCLWVTQGNGRLWWAFADTKVTVDPDNGQRIRKVNGGWCSNDAHEKPLILSELSSLLTKTFSYQATICDFSPSQREYLLRRLNRTEHKTLAQARSAKDDLLHHLMALIREMDWRDFEVLIDLIFVDSGWRRVNAVGGSKQKDSDLLLIQSATGERAMVQIKSSTDQNEFSQYQAAFKTYLDFDRLFFVAHTFKGEPPSAEPGVHLWLGADVADKVLKAGLVDWVMAKAA